MVSDWKRGFHAAVIRAIITNGSPLDDKPDGFGWLAGDWERILATVRAGEVDYDASTYAESDWHEFMGTFYEGDTRVVGIDAAIALRSGERFVWRWKGTASDLIEHVLSNADE